MAIRVVVDSTADIPPARARELGIQVVPLTVQFGDQTFRDGVDLDGAAFYRKLTSTPVMPTTSTPPPAHFEEAYRSIVRDGSTGILAMHISSSLSGTYSASMTAAETVTADTGVPIAVIDSRQVSAGFGLPAEIVAAEAREGRSLEELRVHAEDLCSRMRLVAVLDTLEFLQRGGRIGRAQALLGTLLNVKPLLEVRDGQVLPLEKVRTRGKALERIAQIISKLGELEAVSVAASDEAICSQLTATAHTFWNGPVEQFSLGPVVGTHAGPGAGGLAVIVRG